MSQPTGRSDRVPSSLATCQIIDAEGVDVFARYARMAAALVGTPMAAVSFIDGDVWCKSVTGSRDYDPNGCGPFCAQTMLADAPLLVIDPAHDPRFADAPMVRGAPGLRFYLGAPLRLANGTRVGAVSAFAAAVHSAGPAVVDRLAALADAVTATLELYRTMREVQRLALTDTLTGLSNRVHLFQALATARNVAQNVAHTVVGDVHQPISILCIDCDNFRQLNDMFGQRAGDEALQTLASMLRQGQDATALAARLAGDAFVVMLPGKGAQAAGGIAAQILQRGRDLMAARGWPTTLSIGVVTFEVPPASGEIILALADEAMFHAKSAGGNQVSAITIGAPFKVVGPHGIDPGDSAA